MANRARHHVRPFRSIEGISEPFLAMFFFMAGYQMHWAALLALVATERLPSLDYILPLVIGATVVFELIGPTLTLAQLQKAGETGKGYQPEEDDEP